MSTLVQATRLGSLLKNDVEHVFNVLGSEKTGTLEAYPTFFNTLSSTRNTLGNCDPQEVHCLADLSADRSSNDRNRSRGSLVGGVPR